MAIQHTALRTADDAPGALSPEGILRLGLGFWGSRTLLSAVELGVFSELTDGPLAGEELAARLELHPRSWRAFLDALGERPAATSRRLRKRRSPTSVPSRPNAHRCSAYASDHSVEPRDASAGRPVGSRR